MKTLTGSGEPLESFNHSRLIIWKPSMTVQNFRAVHCKVALKLHGLKYVKILWLKVRQCPKLYNTLLLNTKHIHLNDLSTCSALVIEDQ